jgi:hypothetical protein
MGYLIEPNTEQIIQAKVTITEAELLAGGIIKNIPEFPAVRLKAYKVLYFLGQFSGTPYVTLSAGTIHIEIAGTGIPQFRFTGNPLLASPFFKTAPENTQPTAVIQYSVNSQLQIHSPAVFTGGTGDLTLYIGAFLFTV